MVPPSRSTVEGELVTTPVAPGEPKRKRRLSNKRLSILVPVLAAVVAGIFTLITAIVTNSDPHGTQATPQASVTPGGWILGRSVVRRSYPDASFCIG
jgi:hypothetical protein